MLILHIHGSHGQMAGTGSELFSPMMSPTWFIPTIGKGKPCSGKACYIGNSFGFAGGGAGLQWSVKCTVMSDGPDHLFLRLVSGKK